MSQEFQNSVKKCARKAANEANDMDVVGDPATHITAYVDGRTKFVQDFKKFAEKTRSDSYNIGPVKVKDGRNGYVLTISGLEGTNIQNHNKKRALYEKFEEYMRKEGWSMGLKLEQYAR
jgi:hypothetical protein